MMTRRECLACASAFGGVAAFGVSVRHVAAKESFEITRSKAEWKAILTPAQFAVLREEATEKPFSNSLKGEMSTLLKESREGTYNCAGCDLAVYESKTKFDSGTGWPSFWDSIRANVRTKSDNTLFTKRTEVHCRRCGGHLGHIFNDGPKPTGKRHCLNGLAMSFKAAA